LSAIFLPILLIIGALSAILIVFGRHLPDFVRSIKERKDKKESLEPIDELPVNPRVHQLVQPQKNNLGGIASKVNAIWKFLLVKAVFVVKHVWPALKLAGSLLVKLFHRVPRIKPNLSVLSRFKDVTSEEVDYRNIEEFVEPVATTADMKSVQRNPLRYPEPLSNELVALTQPKKKTVDKIRKEIPKIVETQVEAIIEEINAEQTKMVPEKAVDGPVVEKPAFSVGKTKETRTRNRRRIVGKMAPKPTPLQELEKTIMAEESEEKEVFSVNEAGEITAPELSSPIEEKKISFIDREAYALTDATQEISNQILEGKYNVAESALIDILSKNPRNTEAYRLLGIVYLKRKDFEQAREVFEEALRRDPEHGGLQGPLGYCYMSVGEYGKALSMYQQALNMDETNIEYLEQLLIISSRMDRRPLVNMTAKKILALNPNHVEAKKYLARVAVR
jgi:Flp pilus assembly protein TadD